MHEHVVLVHGLYMAPAVMRPLASRLESVGYSVSRFGYGSVTEPIAAHVESLRRHVAAIDAPTIHFVGHSMGGLIIRAYFDRVDTACNPGSIVTLGTPHQGASIAHRLVERGGQFLLGKSAGSGLLRQDVQAWLHDRALGSIAGVFPVGPRTLLMRSDVESDGTVTVEETRLVGMCDHIVLPCAHTALIYSSAAFNQVVFFLKSSQFDHRPTA